MIELSKPWAEQPLLLVTMNPIRGKIVKSGIPDFDRFCAIGLGRWEQGALGDYLISDVRHHEWTVTNERELAWLNRSDQRHAPPLGALFPFIEELAEQAVPVAVNVSLAKRLLHKEIDRVERETKHSINRDGRFLLRKQSRWIDLSFWRGQTTEKQPWSTVDMTISERFRIMGERFATMDGALTLGELLDAQRSART